MSVKNDSKGFLKEKLGEYRVDPPESVWSNIQSQLGGRNRRTIMLITLAAAATLALAISLGINYFGPDISADKSLSELQGEEMEQRHPDDPAGTEQLKRAQDSDDLERVADEAGPLDRDEAAGRSRTEEVTRDRESRLKERVMTVLDEQVGERGELADRIEEESTMERSAIAQSVTGERSDLSPSESEESGLVENPRQEGALQPVENQPQEEALQPVEDQPLDTAVQPEDHENISLEPGDGEELPGSEPVEIPTGNDRDKSRWALGAYFSPLYSFRDAQMDALEAGADFESGVLAYAGGIQVSYRTAGRISFESGLYYNKMGVDIGAPGIELFTAINAPADFANLEGANSRSQWVAVSNSVGNIVSKSGDIFVNEYKVNAATYDAGSFQENAALETTNAEEGIRQHLDYLELPFNVRYTVVDRALELQLIGGLSTNFLVNNSVTMDTPSGPEEIGYLSNIRNVNYSGNAGLGMIYHIHDRFSLRLEPRFRYFLHSVNDETLPSTRPYSLGFYTGLSYTF